MKNHFSKSWRNLSKIKADRRRDRENRKEIRDSIVKFIKT